VSRRQDRAVRAGRAAWAAAVARQPLGVAARLVAGQLADRATGDGRVRVAVAEVPASCCPPAAAVAEVPASCCPPAAAVADALADLASRGLLVRDGGALVLTVPAEGWL
jgi:hypothetical protein